MGNELNEKIRTLMPLLVAILEIAPEEDECSYDMNDILDEVANLKNAIKTAEENGNL